MFRYQLFAAASLFLFSQPAHSETPLRNLEANCWSKGTDEGSFLCQYLMLMGKTEGQEAWVIPELYAPSDEAKAWGQAHLACELLGFSYSKGYQLANTEKETLLIRLESTAAYVWQGQGKFIQHLKCE